MNKLFFRLSLLFLIAGIGFVSCSKEDALNEAISKTEVQPSNRQISNEPNTSEEHTFLFQKDMVLRDHDGNSVFFTLEANSQERLDEYDISNFELSVNTDLPPPNTMDEIDNQTSSLTLDDEIENDPLFVNIMITGYSFNENVTGFSIIPKSDKRYALFVSYGMSTSSTPITGAFVRYIAEKCSNEWLKVKLYRKTRCRNWFWDRVLSQDLNSPPDFATYHQSSSDPCWKLKIYVRGLCTEANGPTVFLAHWWIN